MQLYQKPGCMILFLHKSEGGSHLLLQPCRKGIVYKGINCFYPAVYFQTLLINYIRGNRTGFVFPGIRLNMLQKKKEL